MSIPYWTLAQELTATSFDFWLGKWDLTWVDPNGSQGKGSNRIMRILDDQVIQEHFEASEGLYKGMKGTSISVFNPQTKMWHQTWQDNQGGNLVFTGRIDGDRKYFETALQNGQQSRMVFYGFSENGFFWDWESTIDSGQTWTLNWRIHYTKKE